MSPLLRKTTASNYTIVLLFYTNRGIKSQRYSSTASKLCLGTINPVVASSVICILFKLRPRRLQLIVGQCTKLYYFFHAFNVWDRLNKEDFMDEKKYILFWKTIKIALILCTLCSWRSSWVHCHECRELWRSTSHKLRIIFIYSQYEGV